MTATYDSSLPTNKDHVRFLIGDITPSTDALLSDEEISAVLTEETANGISGQALKYFAAARCLSALYTLWSSKGKGIVEKQVSRLRVKRGIDASAAQSLEARISELRKRGAFLLSPSAKTFKSL